MRGLFENVKMALSSLYAHKVRSILTMIGIVIGVASVILVVAIGQGGEAMLKSKFSGEANVREIYYEPSDEEIDADTNILFETAFSEEDVRIIENIPEVQHVIRSSSKNAQIRHYESSTQGTVKGVSQEYLDVNKLEIARGRNLTNSDIGSRNF